MKSLSFLNLRGCTSLSSLPEMNNLVRLKTLVLSGCSSFDDFHVNAKNLEHVHLDGTEILNLPRTIEQLQRLIVLNLKDCKRLRTLPDCLGKLKALEELILSGCSRLRRFPEIKEGMENLQILLLDRTEITDVPKMLLLRCANPVDQVNNVQPSPRTGGLSLLRHLCLSRNDKIISLRWSISELYHLKWIDVKYCKKLQSISMLPPNLQCLDAHGCTSLKTVASPPMATEQVPSSFIFTNCDKLEHVAKNEITCYGHDKGRILSKTLNRHNKVLFVCYSFFFGLQPTLSVHISVSCSWQCQNFNSPVANGIRNRDRIGSEVLSSTTSPTRVGFLLELYSYLYIYSLFLQVQSLKLC